MGFAEDQTGSFSGACTLPSRPLGSFIRSFAKTFHFLFFSVAFRHRSIFYALSHSALLSILTNKTKEKKKTGKRRWVDCRRSSRGVTSPAFPLKCKVTAIWEDADFKPFVEVDLALFFLFVCRKHYLMTTQKSQLDMKLWSLNIDKEASSGLV